MRPLLFFVFLCVGNPAHAQTLPGQDADWATIRANVGWSKLKIIQDDFSKAFGDEGYFNACVDGNTLRSVAPVEICADENIVTTVDEGGSGAEGYGYGTSTRKVCVKHSYEPVAISLDQVVSGPCAKYSYSYSKRFTTMKCTEPTTLNIRLSTHPELSVNGYEYEGAEPQASNYHHSKVLFKKEYQIPNCH